MITVFSGSAANRTTSRLVAFAAVTAIALSLTACSSRSDSGSGDSSGAPATTVESFAIVAPENESDHGWNQAGLAGATEAADALGIKVEAVADAGWDNAESIISQLTDSGSQFIIAHASGYAEPAQVVAKSTGVPVLVMDAGTKVAGKVAVLSTEAQEGGYLAGVAAALSTTTKKVGIVISADDQNWFKMSAGFAEGVYSIDPTIEIIFAQVGPADYANSAGGKSTTEQVIAAGADVIFGMGDGATVGYLQAVESSATPVKYIASIGDVTEAVTDPSIILTSVLWNFGPTYKAAIEAIDAGTYGEENYSLTVANGGLTLQDSQNMTADIKTAVDAASAAISDGSVVPTAAKTSDEVKAVIAAKK